MDNSTITYNLSIRDNTYYRYSGTINIIFNKDDISDIKDNNYDRRSTVIYNYIVSRIAPEKQYKYINGVCDISLNNFDGDRITEKEVIKDFVNRANIYSFKL